MPELSGGGAADEPRVHFGEFFVHQHHVEGAEALSAISLRQEHGVEAGVAELPEHLHGEGPVGAVDLGGNGAQLLLGKIPGKLLQVLLHLSQNISAHGSISFRVGHWNFGGRFSRKANTPSRKLGEAAHSAWNSCSRAM